MTSDIKILDCTLRDGGYVNNWEFGFPAAKKVVAGLYDSGISVIEIGIMGRKSVSGKQTLFSGFSEMEPLLENRKDNCEYALMINVSDVEQYDIPRRSDKTVDSIRLAFFKSECTKAIQYTKEIKEKGYNVYLQTMASFSYTEKELDDLLSQVNAVLPYAFYMVDSFGTMMPFQVTQMERQIAKKLDKRIVLGFHAHNNIQMAFANVAAFLEEQVEHKRIVDSSIFGMGRGAGNVPTELLMNYFSEKYGETFHWEAFETVYDEVIAPIFDQYYWGYSMNYMLTSKYKLNSAYGWYLGTKNVTKSSEFDKIVSQIGQEEKLKLNKALIDRFVSEL